METDDHTPIPIGPDGPELEAPQVIRFLMERFDEMLENKDPIFPIIFKGLAISAVACDEQGYTEIMEILSPSAQMKHCRDILARTLARPEDWGPLQPVGENGEKGFQGCSERDYRQMLLTALRESKRMISRDKYEFASVFASMGWVALQCYPRRLAEFEEVVKSFQDDPREVVRRGKDVLWTAIRTKDEPEIEFQNPEELTSRRKAQNRFRN